jgi:hypothetical protein
MFTPSDRKTLEELRHDYHLLSDKLESIIDHIAHIETKLEEYEWVTRQKQVDNIPSRGKIYKLDTTGGIPRVIFEKS